MTIAKTILQQLGGSGRLVAMTGAKNFVAVDNGLSFKVGRNAQGVNYVRIILNSMDVYDVQFCRVRTVKGIPTIKVISEHSDIYDDMLIPLFERGTGMYLSLGNLGGAA